jgi:hypothetical protein
MRRGTIVLLFFILVAAAIVGISQYLRAQPPLEVTLAVSPLAERWVRDAVAALNATEPITSSARRYIVRVQTVDDTDVWQDDRRAAWTTQNHPAGWIPASYASLGYAIETRQPFQPVRESLARTPLVWGGYESRVNTITNGGAAAFDWSRVAEIAAAERWANVPNGNAAWGNVNIGFSPPASSTSGLAVLLSAAADYSDTAALDSNAISDANFRDWFRPVAAASIPNFNTLGADPAAAIASRGASVAALALLPESQWLNNLNGLIDNEPMLFAYPEYGFVFDFPLAVWSDASTTDDERQVITAVGAWLAADAQQARLSQYGLRPTEGEPTADDALFTAALPYGIALMPDYGRVIVPPSRIDAQRLLQWFTTAG